MMMVIANNERNRIQLLIDGQEVGIIDYLIYDKYANVSHTEVYPEFAKHGYAELLVKSFINFADNKGYTKKAVCPYALAYFKKNKIDFETD